MKLYIKLSHFKNLIYLNVIILNHNNFLVAIDNNNIK